MSDEPLQPLNEDANTTAEDFIDPYGEGPKEIPDPMPDELLAADDVDQTQDPTDGNAMQGESPTG